MSSKQADQTQQKKTAVGESSLQDVAGDNVPQSHPFLVGLHSIASVLDVSAQAAEGKRSIWVETFSLSMTLTTSTLSYHSVMVKLQYAVTAQRTTSDALIPKFRNDEDHLQGTLKPSSEEQRNSKRF